MLLEHPSVESAGVIGIHDSVHGENVRAYITLREGCERPSDLELIRSRVRRSATRRPRRSLCSTRCRGLPPGRWIGLASSAWPRPRCTQPTRGES